MKYQPVTSYWGGGSGGTVAGPLAADGRIFRVNGEPWRWKGFSAFRLLDRFARGEDLRPFLDAYRGYNIARVWPYVPVKQWGAAAWDSPRPDAAVAFLEALAAEGFYSEITLLLDDDPARIAPAQRLVSVLKSAQPKNLTIEIGNEPRVNKSIDTRVLKADLDASGFLYASGDSAALAFGSYGTLHTARTRDWTRRAHDLMEFYNGGGPDAPTDPAHKCPPVADEPGKVQDVGTTLSEWRAYFGACSLFGAGATFHSETGKHALPPTDDERRCAAAALEGLNAFPADAPNGPYRKIVEPGNEPGGPTVTSRTYVVGSCMVRCQQVGTSAPEPGWTALDAEGILWRR